MNQMLGSLFIGVIFFLVGALIYMFLRSALRHAQRRGDVFLHFRRVRELKQKYMELKKRVDASSPEDE